MIINLNNVEVKGMKRGELYTPGDWFIIPKSDGYDYANNVVTIYCAPENANLFMQAVASPMRNRSALNALGFGGTRCQGINQLGMVDFWDEQFDAVHEGLDFKLAAVVYKEHDIKPELPSDVTGLLNMILELALYFADTAGIKLHPKTLKAMQEYIQELPVQVKYAIESGEFQQWLNDHDYLQTPVTELDALVYVTYRSHSTCTSFGTLLDDIVSTIKGGMFGPNEACRRRCMQSAARHLLRDFIGLNLFYSNGQFWPIGYGFQSGNPVLVLAKLNPDMSVRTQVVRIGRYFSCFDGVVDIRDSINDLKMLNQEMKYHLCVTEQEWHAGYNGGVSSCMANFDFDCSPVRVYATTSHGLPDNKLRLFISYVGELFGKGFRVLARAIVNIELKQYVRAYGSNADAVLRAAGYTRDTGCTEGCTLAKIDGPYRGYLMPYQDGDADCVDDQGDCWMLCSGGEYDACEPEGILEVEAEEEIYCCDYCGYAEPVQEAAEVETLDGYETWCHSCRWDRATHVTGRGYVSDTLLEQEQGEADEEGDENGEAA